MTLEQYKSLARLLVIRLADLMVEAAADESIKKEPQLQRKIASTALTLLVEAETLEKEIEKSKLRSDNSISE